MKKGSFLSSFNQTAYCPHGGHGSCESPAWKVQEWLDPGQISRCSGSTHCGPGPCWDQTVRALGEIWKQKGILVMQIRQICKSMYHQRASIDHFLCVARKV